MSKKKVVKKDLDPKQAARKAFQDLVAKSKECDFKCDTVTVPCPEAGEGCSIVLHAMTMADQDNMRDFAKKHESCPKWIAVLMFSAKYEDGEYMFTTEDDIKFIESQGVKWFKRYGYPALELGGFLEEFDVSKK